MRILLIHPPDSKASLAPGRFEPLGLEVLAAVVPDHDVRILDLRIDDFKELDHQLTILIQRYRYNGEQFNPCQPGQKACKLYQQPLSRDIPGYRGTSSYYAA
jgi:hypothetical protein